MAAWAVFQVHFDRLHALCPAFCRMGTQYYICIVFVFAREEILLARWEITTVEPRLSEPRFDYPDLKMTHMHAPGTRLN